MAASLRLGDKRRERRAYLDLEFVLWVESVILLRGPFGNSAQAQLRALKTCESGGLGRVCFDLGC